MSKTTGELRVRVDFNPSLKGIVDEIKQKTAELIDLTESIREGEDLFKSPEKSRLVAIAMTSYEEAAMWAVKAATL